MYWEILQSQWKNLYSEFAAEYERLNVQLDETAAFNHWYEAKIHRWNSVVYTEGIILEQQNNDLFSKEIKEAMENFQFKKVEKQNLQINWIGLVVGTVVCLCAGKILTVLNWGKFRAIISGLVLWAVIVSAIFQNNSKMKKEEERRIKAEYIQQLKDYQKQLEAVCDKFNMK